MRGPRRKRLNDDMELRAWRDVFLWGRDYFRRLEPLGLFAEPYDPIHQVDEIRAAAREVWMRIGAKFMQTWRPEGGPPHRQQPWALEEFGKPRRR